MSWISKIVDELRYRRSRDLSPPPAVDTGSVLAVVGDEVRHIAQDGAPDGYVLTVDSGSPGNLAWLPGGGGGGGGAPTNATFLTMSLNGTLTNERVFTVTSAGALVFTDNGAGSTAVLTADDDVEAIAAFTTQTGLVARIDDSPVTYAARALVSATTDYLTVANADGVAGNPALTLLPYAILLLLNDLRFGDGSDGNVTLVADTLVLRPTNYNNLNLAGFRLVTNGFVICVKGTLTMGGGIIESAGSNVNGLTINGAANGAGNAAQAGPLGQGTGGGLGGSGAGAAGNGTGSTSTWSTRINNNTTSGKGGDGGTGASGIGGTAGAVSQPLVVSGWTPATLHTGSVIGGASVLRIAGGSGGGGGRSGGAGFAGGGGAGGGVCIVLAKLIDGSAGAGTIRANGGNGGTPTGANAGGGGSGGGGHVRLEYALLVAGSLPTLQANAGTPGGFTGTGTAGAAGTAGTTEAISLFL